MEWQTDQQRRGNPSPRFYPKQQIKKSFVNYPKASSIFKASKTFLNKTPQYNYYVVKSSDQPTKDQRKPLGSYNAYAAAKPQKASGNEHIAEVDKYFETINYFVPKLSTFKRVNQNGATSSYSGSDKESQITELSGFKIVQNGITIHDETFDGKIPDRVFKETIIIFSHEDKFKPHTESVLTIGPRSKEISLPTFIEAQE
jgi:hypothetical protein